MINKKIRIDRLLSNLGLVERSSVPRFLNEKRVTISGRRATIASKALPEEIRIDGKPIENPSLLHLALHKPSGYICSTVNDGDHKIVYDLLPKEFVNRKPLLSIAGRLDKWVTGLVIFSQDGKLVDKIITPKVEGLGKDYEVILQNKMGGDEASVFESGTLMLRGEETPCKPAKLQVLDEGKNKVKVTLFEGRYHQVRRMFAANDNKALEIHRTRIGPVNLGDLPLGKWRHLTEKEVQDLYGIQPEDTRLKKQEKVKEKEKEKEIKVKKVSVKKGDEAVKSKSKDQDRTYNDIDDDSYDMFDLDDNDEDAVEFEDDMVGSVNKQEGNQEQEELGYDDKLKILINSENGMQKAEAEINDSIKSQVKKLYDNVELRTASNDPYKDLRAEIQKKMKLKIAQIGRGKLVLDVESNSFIPKEEIKNRMPDEELERLIEEDEDIKEYEQFRMEQLQEEQEELNNKSKKRSNVNNREKLQPSKVLENGSEVYQIDSTPDKIDEIIKKKINASKKKTGKSIKRKNK